MQGVLRRGMQVAALREFILSQGASKNVTLQEWDKIWTINKRHIDPVCPRHTAVRAEGKVCSHQARTLFRLWVPLLSVTKHVFIEKTSINILHSKNCMLQGQAPSVPLR